MSHVFFKSRLSPESLEPLIGLLVESCVGRVNLHGLRVPTFAGQEPTLFCVRVVLGAGQAQVEKLFLRVTEC